MFTSKMGKGKQNLIQMQRSLKARLDLATSSAVAGEGEGEVAFFSAKRWDRRNTADLIESVTPCHDAQVVGSYRDSNALRLTVLAAMSEAGSADFGAPWSEDYTTAPQHLQMLQIIHIERKDATNKFALIV